MSTNDVNGLIPVLEIGGTHLTAAVVDPDGWQVVQDTTNRLAFDGRRDADALIADMARAAATLGGRHGADWAVATPGPFDYEAGIGRFEDVGKFDSLRGVDVRERLRAAISPRPASIRFVNDADAFGLGEYAGGAAAGAHRAVCITLGTGIGSAFLAEGEPVNAGLEVPPDGSAHLLVYRGRPLEETVSRRAIVTAYGEAAGIPVEQVPDVHILAERSRSGDEVAQRVLAAAFEHLGRGLAESVDRFRPDVLVIGGSMSRSWDIVEPALRRGLAEAAPRLGSLPLRQALRLDDAALIGAAVWSRRPSP
ncbi:ROK family protein [Naasia sp. SYSU D00057]|uniref:ROK family protein n=1 Tax=Naasia sp. SYSU D00057 TaxID=2817380 RepID=UPI001B31173C|nr:ROK family protein [Naasia sp. SYSU D00057]